MKPKLDIDHLIAEARDFCAIYSGVYTSDLYGITDGKAVGTYIEHRFKRHLSERYDLETGNTALGLDLPSVNTDIKVTSIRQPQSSCPFKDSKQKIFGLGYNLIVMVYDRHDNPRRRESCLDFVACIFIDQTRTADYQTTTGLLNIIANNGNRDDVFAFLLDHHIPADEVTLYNLAQDILDTPPNVGYLTISNALQWRLQYSRAIALDNNIKGIVNIACPKK